MKSQGTAIGIRLHLRATEDGGRMSAVACNREGAYRPNWSRDEVDAQHQTGAPVLLLRPTILNPGSSGLAVIRPLHQPDWSGIGPGDRLFMFEGPRLCGEAEVIEVWSASEPLDDESRHRAEAWIEGGLLND
jgi:hypothetical protein